MQNKGAIRLFAILLALVCLYQLSFTWAVRGVENEAEVYADGDSQLYFSYLDSMKSETALNILVREYTYSECKSREINLGLDLKGGMNVMLEVGVQDILKALSKNSSNPVFNQALANAAERQKNSQADYITLFYDEWKKANTAQGTSYRLADVDIFGNRELKDKITFESTDDQVIEVIREEAEGAIERAFTVLRARIDKFGVAQPNIQRLEGSGRILVELPGVKEPERVKKLLQSTANLEFYETFENIEIIPFLNSANERLRDLVERPSGDTTNSDTSKTDETQLDIESIGIAEETEAEDPDSLNDEAANAEETEAESDTSLAAESDFNPLFEVLVPNYNFETNVPGEGPVVGFVAIRDTGKVNDYLSRKQIRDLLPAELRYVKFLWEAPNQKDGSNFLRLVAIKSNRENVAELQGDAIVDAIQDYDQMGAPSITMRMSNQGAAIWAKMTRENVDRSIAVVLDNYVYSFPTVNEEIKNGVSTISGSFTVKEAKDLANILKAGKLPAPARIIQAEVVGPSLGKEAIQAGLYSFLLALLVVLLYMIFYYSTAGVVSNIALLVNMFFVIGVLASVQAVLTLPGIAGIVLTIGMAVDANVLIYERIREELRAGKGLKLAISDGYKNAYSSIIDANITTLLTGIILFTFGTGPIRGFASTLIIGILTSLFSAIFITRLVYERMLDRKRNIKFSTKLTEAVFTNANVPFIAKRKMFYMISAAVIVIGLGSLFTRGLNLGIDFTGGRSYQVRFDQDVNTVQIADALENVFIDANGLKLRPEVKTFGGANQVRITTKYKIEDKGMEVDEVDQEVEGMLYNGVTPFFVTEISREDFFNDQEDKAFGLMSSFQVNPTIADDIRTSAIWSILFSLIVIFLYILIRFRKWQFSLGAVIAVFHDVLIVLALFSLFYGIMPFSLEIDQAFIAAILTVIGYSLNDTVVVFDRIREYLPEHKRRPLDEVINYSINSTLSRTLNTSLTTIFVLLVIFVFGGETIRGFMFAILVGVVVGTYSSVCIAAPIMYDTTKKNVDQLV